MKITFLIGNGFDVNIGIDSSYSKFYSWYLEQPSIIRHINDFKKSIQEDIDPHILPESRTWADFEVGLGKYTAQFTAEKVSQFLDCYEDAQEGITKYLKEQEAMCDVGAIPEDCIKNFTDTILGFYQEVPDLERMTIDSVCNGVQNESRNITFVSFNYTGILGEILQRLPQTLKKWRHGGSEYECTLSHSVIHAHGTTSAFPIIGVNDDSQIANQELLSTPQFREIMIKAECVNALGQLWHQKAEKQISESRVVCVFGMSLGETDAKWWRKLAVWLKEDGKRHLVIYWYDREPPNGVSVRKQLEGKNKVINRFLSYSELTDKEKSALTSRIHVIINTKVFLKIPKEKIIKVTQDTDEKREATIAPYMKDGELVSI